MSRVVAKKTDIYKPLVFIYLEIISKNVKILAIQFIGILLLISPIYFGGAISYKVDLVFNAAKYYDPLEKKFVFYADERGLEKRLHLIHEEAVNRSSINKIAVIYDKSYDQIIVSILGTDLLAVKKFAEVAIKENEVVESAWLATIKERFKKISESQLFKVFTKEIDSATVFENAVLKKYVSHVISSGSYEGLLIKSNYVEGITDIKVKKHGIYVAISMFLFVFLMSSFLIALFKVGSID